jgi:hypothetical protein
MNDGYRHSMCRKCWNKKRAGISSVGHETPIKFRVREKCCFCLGNSQIRHSCCQESSQQRASLRWDSYPKLSPYPIFPKSREVVPAQPVDATPALQPELINNTCESNIEAFFVGQSYVRYRSEAPLLKLAYCVRKDLLRNG